MNDRTLTKAFCTIRRMRTGAAELRRRIDAMKGGEEAYIELLSMNSLDPKRILQAQFINANKHVDVLELRSDELHMNVTIDFDETTTFEIVVWNLKDEKEIIVGDQIQIALYWEDYKRSIPKDYYISGHSRISEALKISGFVTSVSIKMDSSDMKYTICGDINTDWAMTYLFADFPAQINSPQSLLSVVKRASISMIKTPDGTIPKQFLIQKKTSIRDVLNITATKFGNNYTWTRLNDTIIFHKNGEPLSQSLDVIALNNSDVIEYEIEDDRMHLKTFGLPELDIGSIFKYLDKAYFVDTIKHTFTHDGGYLCDIYSGEKTENGDAEQSFIDESTFIED